MCVFQRETVQGADSIFFFLQNSCSITKKKSEKIVPFPSTHSTPVSKKNEIIQVCVCVCVQEKKLFFFVFFHIFLSFQFFFLEKNGEDTRSSHTGSRQMKKKTIEERDALRCHPPTHTIVKKMLQIKKKIIRKGSARLHRRRSLKGAWLMGEGAGLNSVVVFRSFES